MGSPTQISSGATCTKVQLQSHLSISTQEQNGVSTATEFYIINWDAWATTENCRGATDGNVIVPVRSNLHPVNPALACRRVEIRPLQNESHLNFQARVEYSDDETTPLNPCDMEPQIEWDIAEDGKVPYFLDNDPAGPKPVVNKAGERFSEFLQRYEGTVTATFTINIPLTGTYTSNITGLTLPAWNPATVINYVAGGSILPPNATGSGSGQGSGAPGSLTSQNTPVTNSDTFTFDGQQIGIGQARPRGCTCSPVQTQNGVKYRVKKWSLAFKSTWLDIVDNRGFNEAFENVMGQNVLKEIVKGSPPVKPDTPWPLDENGYAMPNATDIPPQLTFYPYRQLPFAPLGFK